MHPLLSLQQLVQHVHHFVCFDWLLQCIVILLFKILLQDHLYPVSLALIHSLLNLDTF